MNIEFVGSDGPYCHTYSVDGVLYHRLDMFGNWYKGDIREDDRLRSERKELKEALEEYHFNLINERFKKEIDKIFTCIGEYYPHMLSYVEEKVEELRK